MDDSAAWKALLDNWPAGIARAGVIVTTLNEQIPFEGFMHTAAFVMVERKTPDTLGARKIVIPLSAIALIKFVEVIGSQAFAPWGFVGAPAGKKAPA
jgi:hypothetical protein